MKLVNWTPRTPISATTLVGRYVRIDPLNISDDVPLLWDALGGNDDTINERLKWYGIPSLKNTQQLESLLATLERPGDGWAVNVMRLATGEAQGLGEVVGMASYIATETEHGSTEIGYVAHGLRMSRTPAATEAHYLLAKHAIETKGYRRYEWKCDSQNTPSRKTAVRLGFQYEGLFRQHRVTASGSNRDTCWYSMLDSEWLQRKMEFEAWLDPSNFDDDKMQRRKLEDIRNASG
jgi:RimJ/RimL family protein N-acetyltransferase